MKILATIKSVEIVRSFPHQDGTFGNVYGVTIESGDDEIIAETFVSKEGQERRGIVPGKIGTAVLEFSVSRGVSKSGQSYTFQRIGLKRFDLANRNISTESAQTAAGGADTQPKAEKPAESTQVPAEPEPQPEEGKTSDLPF
jgi:hypothetical protein